MAKTMEMTVVFVILIVLYAACDGWLLQYERYLVNSLVNSKETCFKVQVFIFTQVMRKFKSLSTI